MRFDGEMWKPVLGYEGRYEVSNFGRVRALFKAGNFHKAGRILVPWVMKVGYFQVRLYKADGTKKNRTIHTLVLEAFKGPSPSPEFQCRHLNGSRTDNLVDNLEWGTPVENGEDRKRHGTQALGEQCGSAKLNADQVKTIRWLDEYKVPHKKIAEIFGVDRTNVWNIVARKTWSHI